MDEKKIHRMSLMVVAASWLAVFVLFGYRATFSVLKVPMQEAMGWSASQISLGYSIMMTVYAITAFFSGMIIDRWGTKPAYFLAAIFGALGFIVSSFAQNLWQFYAAYGILAGIGTGMLWVSSTVSVRKWFVGKYYAKMWGWAFMGAPLAQVILSLGVKSALKTADWRTAMQVLGGVACVALFLATALAKKSPEAYGIAAFGETPAKKSSKKEYLWGVKEAFSTYPVWGVVLAFMGSMIAEFLIWTQVVSYWSKDLGMSLDKATNLYAAIGFVGIFTMVLMGIVADKVVQKVAHEAKGRKVMLIFAPAVGVVACGLLLMSKVSIVFGLLACVLFATYWAIEPGGVVGYTGAIYGRKTLGKVWGFATLICMGIGPFTGAYIGGLLKDVSGSYTYSIFFALGSFVFSSVIAATLPLACEPKAAVEPDVAAAAVR